jgi:phage terminase small subunit
MAPLNHKQKRFALEYRVDHNAGAAAERAGYSHRGSATQGMRLLMNAEVQKLIAAHDTKVLAKVEEKGNRVLEELAHIGFSDPIDMWNTCPGNLDCTAEKHYCDRGTLKALSSMKPEMRRAIKSIKFTELFDGASGEKFVAGRVVEITLWDKTKGLELLGKNQKLFTDKVEVSADESLLDLLTEAHRPGGTDDD